MTTPAPETIPAPLTLTLFGPMRALVAGQPLPHLHSRKSLWLLALLALRQGRPVEREWLAGTLWPDADQDQAFANLRPVLSDLRRTLGEEGVRLQSPNRHTLCLDLANADVDTLAFDAAMARKTPEALAQAVALYSGPLLEGCAEEWVPQERRVREEGCLQALQTLADTALAAGDYGKAAEYSRRAVVLDPWRDGAQRGLMEALSRGGDTNAALQVYREFTELLRGDPKAAPDAETSAFYARLRAEARRQVSSPLVAAAQVPVPAVTGYLPHPLTDLVGREDERLEVAAKLRRSRLVTLTGPGGIGKTRLAVEVAGDAAPEFADGVWLVSLEALADEDRLEGQIAGVLGLKETPGRSWRESLTQHLRAKRLLLVLDNCEHLRTACAQVTAHLLHECARVRVLATSREALGVTGETVWVVPALAVPGLDHLPPGRATLARVLAGYDSVQLFVERAQAVQKTFSLTGDNAPAVAQVCSRLEGMPLAIELAAARINVLTVSEIASRLDDHLDLLAGRNRAGPSRQQTLRATLDWSYSLLSGLEQTLLRRLSVFAGGWGLAAAESVCIGDGLEAARVLDLTASLADKSLVVFEPRETGGRYRLLETVRQYAAERLRLAGEAAFVRTMHRDYFLAQAEEAESQLYSAAQGIWLVRLEAEHANLRAALDWCGAEPDAAAGLRLAGALGQFWEMHGYYNEGRASLSEALRWEGAERESHGRAKALNVAGVLAFYQGDIRGARRQHEEGLAISRKLGDRKGAAWALNNLGDVVSTEGDFEAAWTLYTESLAIFRELNNRQGIAQLLHHLGRIRRDQGDYTEAGRLYEEGLAIQQGLGDRLGVAWALHHLGNLAGLRGDLSLARTLQEESLTIFRELGSLQGAAWALQELGKATIDQATIDQAEYDTARALYTESLAIFQELGNQQGVASLLHHLGRLAHEQGDYAEAQRLYEAVLGIQEVLSGRQGAAWVLTDLGRAAADQGYFAPARVFYAEGLSLLMGMGDRRGAALCLCRLGARLSARGNTAGAVRVWGAAEALGVSISGPQTPRERKEYAQHVAQARSSLGEDAFAASWAAGCALTWEAASTYALEGE